MSSNSRLCLDQGLVHDTRCSLQAHDEWVLDYENAAAAACKQSDAWSFVSVVRVDPAAVHVNTEVGVVFGDDCFSFGMGSRNFLELAQWGGGSSNNARPAVWWVQPSPVPLRTGYSWIVLGPPMLPCCVSM